MLDPRWPPDRLRRIRDRLQLGPAAVDDAHRELALAAGFPASALVEIARRPEPDLTGPPRAHADPDHVAFLIQTSGSTGTPKSVMQTHRNVVHNALVRLAGGLGIASDDRIVLLASPSGGQGLSTVWTALLSGATLCPFPAMERGVTGLPEWLTEQGVTVLVSSASLFRHFMRTLDGRRLTGVRLVRLGSEQVFSSDFDAFCRHFGEDCHFVNSFSSSETGNITQQVLTAADEPEAGALPVGTSVPGMDLSVLDDGEVVVRSDYLSPGYWGDEALTSQRFAGGVFHTGDLGRISEDGALTLLGRRDAQVKVRGSRVDLVEVESALAGRPGIAATAVRPRPAKQGDTALTAYVALDPGVAPDTRELRDALRGTLPPHAVPTAFAFVDALPLNAHGKVDADALALIEPEQERPSNGATPVSETEELLAAIWSTALERESVGPEEDFFALEGDSLTAAEIAAAVHDRFGVEVELDAFADHPTVAAMAELIDRSRTGDDPTRVLELPRPPRDEPIPCSIIQERTWHQSQTPEGSAAYNLAAGMRIQGPLDVEILRRCLDHLVARHEALRTTFAERGGRPVQIVNPPVTLDVPVLEVKRPADADELIRREARVPFDLERGPLVRFLIVRLGPEEHQLLRLHHHINSDGESWGIFIRELAALYEAEARGEPPPLPDRASGQYPDFAAWERETLRPGSRAWREDVEWWAANLEGAPTRTPLPFTRREPKPEAPVSDGVIKIPIPADLTTALGSLQREAGVTHFMVWFSAFAALLARMSGEPDVVVGTYGTTRRLVETRETFGFFANPLTLRVQLPGDPAFREWLAQVRDAVIQASGHARTPYDALCEELRENGTIPPEFQAIFSVADDFLPIRFAGLEVGYLGRTFGSMPWGFTLQPRRSTAGERLVAMFDARLHEPRAVRVFLRRYLRLLARACAEPDRSIDELIPARWRRFGPRLRRRVVERR